MEAGARPDQGAGGPDRVRRSGSRRAAIPVEGRERTMIVPGISPSGQPIEVKALPPPGYPHTFAPNPPVSIWTLKVLARRP